MNLLSTRTGWRSWLRRWSKCGKDAASIPDGVCEILHLLNPSGRTMALGSTQPLTEMSTRDKDGRCVGLTTLPPSCAECLEILEPQPPGLVIIVLLLIILIPVIIVLLLIMLILVIIVLLIIQ